MTAGLAVEELAYADFNVANAVIPVLLMSALIHRHASPRVRDQWLSPLVAGETYVSFGLTEPGSGSDAGALRTKAVADGGRYRISGEKTSVTMLAHAEAMIGVVAADQRSAAHRGGRDVEAVWPARREPGRGGLPAVARPSHRRPPWWWTEATMQGFPAPLTAVTLVSASLRPRLTTSARNVAMSPCTNGRR